MTQHNKKHTCPDEDTLLKIATLEIVHGVDPEDTYPEEMEQVYASPECTQAYVNAMRKVRSETTRKKSSA